MIKKELKKFYLVKPKPHWIQSELISRMREVSTQISNANRRGRGNWIVTSPEFASVLNRIQVTNDYTDSWVQESIDYTNCWDGDTFTHSARTITYSAGTHTII